MCVCVCVRVCPRHGVNANFTSNLSIPIPFLPTLFTASRYLEYLFGIPTPCSFYSKKDCHGRNISELKY